ncbi:hypothetical protein V1478_018384 [Vespula squamosa]|uniref:Uncharacterized protein n=1 Tax=Vespula squamosa TaxID=30214 RepID=A0ABD1ZUX0_VESSQ
MSPLESPSSMRRNERDEPPLAVSTPGGPPPRFIRRSASSFDATKMTRKFRAERAARTTSPFVHLLHHLLLLYIICKCASGENAPLFLAQANEGVADGKRKLCVFSVCEPARRYFRVVFGFIPEGWSVQLADVERRIAVKAPPPRDTS